MPPCQAPVTIEPLDGAGLLEPLLPGKHELTHLVREVTNGQVEHSVEILTNCLLTLNNHPFHVNRIPMTIGSLDVIIGMDWLSKHRAEVLCYEKATRLPLPNGEFLVIYGNKSRKNSRVISCIKANKYLKKGRHTFLTHIVDTEKESKELKDIPEVCNFSDVFPKDLPAVLPVRQVEF